MFLMGEVYSFFRHCEKLGSCLNDHQENSVVLIMWIDVKQVDSVKSLGVCLANFHFIEF